MLEWAKQRRWMFWCGLVFILLLAGGLRLAAAGFSLPYVDHPDEPNYYLAGLEWRDLFDNRGYYDGVPPGYIAVHAIGQGILESLGISGLAATTYAMRHVSILAALFTLIFVALSARLIAGDFAGLIAGSSWGIAPIILRDTLLALPDPLVYVFTAAAIWFALLSVTIPSKEWLSVVSVGAGLIAVVIKYPALPALLPGMIAVLASMRVNRQRNLCLFLIQIAMIGLVGFWLTVIYGVDFGNLQREGAIIRQQGLINLLDLQRHVNNLLWMVIPLSLPLNLIVCGVALLLYILDWKRTGHAPHLLSLVMLGSVIVFTMLLASLYALVELSTVRYVLPATIAVCVLVGISVARLVQALPSHWHYVRQGLTATVVTVLVFIPHLQTDWITVSGLRLPDRRVWLREWFDQNLDPGTVLVDADNHKTFNPIWGGIPHRQWVDWIETDSLTSRSPAQWRDDQGISYVTVGRSEILRLEQSPEGRAFLEAMLPLRDFYAPPLARGPEMRLYRLWRMQADTQIQFGESIQLIGYDLEPESQSILPGSSIVLRFYWKTSSTPVDNYSLFVHLSTLDDNDVLAQVDSTPATAERPTLTWGDRSETLISPRLTLRVPLELEPGTYRLMIGLYNYTTGVRLAPVGVDDVVESDALQLMDVTIAER